MKTVFPKSTPFRPPQRRRALTILEMLVSTALLSVIVLGLTAMFIETQKIFKTGIKQTSVTDAGRSILDMIASDFSQMSDPHFTNVYNPFVANNLLPPNPPTLSWALVPYLQFYQGNTVNGVFVPTRTNQSEDIFATLQTNATWIGIGYTVSNWFTNNGTTGTPFPGIGTLYRYVSSTTAPLGATNLLFTNFNYEIGYGTFTNTWFHRIADGVVHLKIYAFDATGNEMYFQNLYDSGFNTSYASYQYPYVMQNPTNSQLYITNYLPHSIDIELGILEPEALEHARALFASGASGATVAASNYLANAVGQVEIFRQHVIIPAAP